MDGTMLGSHSVRQVAQERQRGRRLTGRSSLVLLLLAATLALFAGPGGVVSPSVAEASHGQLMTLRGTVTINGYRRPERR